LCGDNHRRRCVALSRPQSTNVLQVSCRPPLRRRSA
jgi:hypothetical protein